MTTPCIKQLAYGEIAGYQGPFAISNNTVLLPHSKNIKLIQRPKYAEDQISILYVENILEYEGIIYGESSWGGNIEDAVEIAQRILTTPNRNLTIPELGLGFTGIITPDSDARGGPYPQEVLVEPYANNQAILIKFTILFHTYHPLLNVTPEGFPNNNTAITSISRGYDLTVDEDGDVTLKGETIVTFVKPIILANVSYIIEKLVNFAFVEWQSYMVKGFRYQDNGMYQKDRHTIVQSFIYTEIKHDNALFPGTNQIEAEHEVSSSLFNDDPMQGAGFRTWLNTLSGTIHLGKYTPKVYAFYIMQLLIRNRLLRLELFTSKEVQETVNVIGNTIPNGMNGKYIPLSISLREKIYGRSVEFRFEWMHTSDLESLIYSSGLFRRVNTSYGTYDPTDLADRLSATGVTLGDDNENEPLTLQKQWALWQHSTKDWLSTQFGGGQGILPIRINQMDSYLSWRLYSTPNGYNPNFAASSNYTLEPLYGNTNAIFVPKIPLAAQLNTDPDFGKTQNQSQNWVPSSGSTPNFYNNAPQSQNGPTNKYIEPEYSWLEYKPEYEIIEDAGSIPIDYLEDTGTDFYTGGDGIPLTLDKFQFLENNSQAIAEDAAVKARNYSRIYVRFTGTAMRVGHQIPMPAITEIGGQPAYRVGKPRWKHIEVQAAAEYPVYMALWDVTYTVDKQIAPQDVLSSISQTGTPQQST